MSLTSAKTGGLSGVFISVTTIPAAGNVALGLAFGASHEIWGSTLQLAINLSGMALAGWATLAIQHAVWRRVSAKRAEFLSGSAAVEPVDAAPGRVHGAAPTHSPRTRRPAATQTLVEIASGPPPAGRSDDSLKVWTSDRAAPALAPITSAPVPLAVAAPAKPGARSGQHRRPA